jgi:hypothetical protein
MAVQIALALDDSGHFIHIDQVTGAGSWRCPACGSHVIAKRGDVKAHHFAHKAETSCSSESVIHALAKSIIVEAAQNKEAIWLPSLNGQVSLEHTPEEKWSVYLSKVIKTIYSAKPEVSLESIRFDVLTSVDHIGYLAVEIAVHNRKSDNDIDGIQKTGKACVEIYLDDIEWNITYEALKAKVLEKADRAWLFHPAVEKAKQEAYARLERTFGTEEPPQRDAPKQKTTEEPKLTDKDRLIDAINKGDHSKVTVIPVLSTPPPKFKVNGKTYQSLYRAKYAPKIHSVSDVTEAPYGWRANLNILSEKPGRPNISIPYLLIESDPPELNDVLSSGAVMALTEVSGREKGEPFKIIFVNTGPWIKKLDAKTMKGHERYKELAIAEENKLNGGQKNGGTFER